MPSNPFLEKAWRSETTGPLSNISSNTRQGATPRRLETLHESPQAQSQKPPAPRRGHQSNYGSTLTPNLASSSKPQYPNSRINRNPLTGSVWNIDRPEVIYDDRKDCLRPNEFKPGSKFFFLGLFFLFLTGKLANGFAVIINAPVVQEDAMPGRSTGPDKYF